MKYFYHSTITVFLFFATIIPFMSFGQTQYTLNFNQKNAHIVDVELNYTKKAGKSSELILPTWIPGSYLIREFSKNIIQISAEANGAVIPLERNGKNAWTIPSSIEGKIIVKYQVYAFEKSVRTSYINDDFALINPTSVCLYIEEQINAEHKVKINLPKEWKYVHSGMIEINNEFSARNYDELADSPIILGNHDIFSFEAAGKNHRIAMAGKCDYDQEKLKTDITKIIETETQIFGENPTENYLFIVLNGASGGGGLEHSNSTVLMSTRDAYTDEKAYINFLSLAAHEYFHLWNVKRLRPQELIKYDYTKENYTDMLWLFEGFTSYFDEWCLLKAGIIDNAAYLKRIEGTFGYTINTIGNQVQNLADASHDAWIKYYRRNENSNNTETSYYTKGAFAGMIFNFEIIKNTAGKKNLGSLMKVLYEKYYQSQNLGLSFDAFVKELNAICKTDLRDLATELIYGTAIPDLSTYQSIGIDIQVKDQNKPYLGITTKNTGGKEIVSYVASNGPAMSAGISVDDELIAINQMRVENLSNATKDIQVDKPINVMISREGILKTYEITPIKSPTKEVQLKIVEPLTKEQKTMLGAWLKL
jgi:predicted metalloprotease with PDZ domain